MDFTYPIACVIGFAVGLIGGSVLGFTRLRSLTIIGPALASAPLLNAVLLVNWTEVGRYSASFLAIDLGIIAAMTLVGSVVGATPMVVARLFLRRRP